MLSEETRIAIVHDQLATAGGAGGAEKVLSLAKKAFPDADVITTVYNPARMPEEFKSWNIRSTFIQRLPGSRTHYQLYLPLMPLAIEMLNLNAYDIVLSFSHSVAKGVITRPGSLHVDYCYSPMRYAWDKFHDYLEHEQLGIIKRSLAPPLMSYLRLWDVTASARVDSFLTLSKFVAKRIMKYYRRKSDVLYPPCQSTRFSISPVVDDFYLIVGRMVSYKRMDLAIRACTATGRNLVVIGEGVELQRLQRLAGSTIRFLGRQSDIAVADYYRRCRAFLFTGEEDFGITPLEAQASGRPVIAYGSGGALETIRGVFAGERKRMTHEHTGIFFRKQTVESLIEALREFESFPELFRPASIRAHALRFDPEKFVTDLRHYVESAYALTITQGRSLPR